MPINLDSLLAGFNNREIDFYKPSVTTEGAGTWHSLWAVAGIPTNGATPPAFTAGTGYIPTRATTGALGQVNPAGGANLYLGNVNLGSTVAGSLVIYDRMWACSGFNTTVTTAQNVTTPGSLTAGRDPNTGDDVEIWGEVYGAPGATAATWTVTYVDGAGTAGRTATYAHPANAETVGQMFPFVPAAGNAPGCQQITSLTCSVSSGTAGNIGLTLVRRLCKVPVLAANIATAYDAFALGLPEIYDDACLAMIVHCTATTSGVWLGSISPSEMTP